MSEFGQDTFGSGGGFGGFDSGGGSMDISPASGSANGDFMGGSMGSQNFNFGSPRGSQSSLALDNKVLMVGLAVVAVVFWVKGR